MTPQDHHDSELDPDSEDECPLYSEEGLGPTSNPDQPKVRNVDFDLEDALKRVHSLPACPPCSRVSRRPREIFQDDLHGFITPEQDADSKEPAEGYPEWTRRRKKQGV
ncbi:hypothetical protein NLI96_g2089 [Meripilus lineatus]|uniref:Uncharacterized protein n=1 Tax=Meripilus lineatus TaxID=2056292 RepID=A0AAD5VBG5_9APHY|nr:hypothetical protein NLI96_g2089 [Physisporinus lineatus]